MKKFLLLFAAVGMVFTACESGGDVEEDNGGTPFVPEITISPDELSFPVEGGEQEVAITANFEYKVSEKADWLSVKQTETGLLVTAKESKNTSERSAYISIINEKYSITKTIDIVQEAWVPKIELAQQSVEVEFEPAEYEVAVTSPYSWEATTKNDWIVVESETGIAGEEKLKFTTLRNEEEKVRKGTITLKNTDYDLVAELYVTQKAFVPDEMIIEPESLAFAVEGGTQEVAITANFEYEVSTNADWLTIKKSEKGLNVTATASDVVEKRSTEITISNEKYGVSKVVNVTQGAFVPAITIKPESLAFAVEGGTQEIAITANFEYEVSANADWLTIKKSEKGISVTVPNYVEVDERTAKIIISNKKYGISKAITITQQGVSAESKNAIIYTSSNGKVVTPYRSDVFGANIVSNTYSNGQGIIFFDAPVTSIGTYAFYNCSSLTSVTIPDSVTWMGDWAFYGCTGELIINSKIVEKNYSSDNYPMYNRYSWLYGSKFTKLTIGNSVTSIGSYAFRNCTSLTSVTIPDSVTSMGEWAFYGCTSLTSVNISNLSAWCKIDFSDSYANPLYHAEKLYLNGIEVTELTIPSDITTIKEYAFYGCSSLTNVTIPDSVTSIKWYAFYNCSSLTSVTIGNSVTSIGDNAFYYCRSLTNVTIGNSVTSIGESAFSSCTSLTSVTIPNSVTSIGESAFSGCTSLTSITIPNSVTSIGWGAFYGCKSLTSITIPNSVTSIGNNAFSYCSSLTSITIPDSVTSIGVDTFSDCDSLTSVKIGNSVTSIGSRAFYKCSSLTSVTIGNSVTSIGGDAFYDCSSLTSVYCKPTTPPAGSRFMFYNNASERKIYVPRNSVSAYNSAEHWKNYASYIVGYDF